MKISKIVNYTVIFLEIVILIIFLIWRFKLGITRYFDIDEFAHLHWGYSLFIGERPYTDFFYLFPPFFLYVISSLIAVWGRSVTMLLSARILIFTASAGSAFIILQLGKKMRSLSFGLLAAIVFIFLPLPSDKLLEIRPDNIAIFLALLGLYLFILGEEKQRKKYLFFSGLCYSVSLGIVPKTVFFLIPPMLVLGYKFYHSVIPTEPVRLVSGGISRDSSTSRRTVWCVSSLGMTLKSDAIPFVLGALPAILLLIGLMMTYGNPSFAIYSMTRMSSAVTTSLGSKFYMRPDLFFYPNDTYYGFPNYNLSYLTNLIIYISAAIFAVFRAVSSLSHTDKNKCIREFLVSGSFFANLYAFVFVYPLKHAQYLIPLAPFIAFYFADLWFAILQIFKGEKLRKILILCALFYILFAGSKIYEKKIHWGNQPTLDKVKNLLNVIPAKEPVFDLTGESVFFPNGYYFCCVPYGQYEEALLFNLPNLERIMKMKNAKYIYTGQYERLNILPAIQTKYIRENFVNLWPDGSLLIRK